MSDGEWLNAAVSDDSLVVQVLLRLRHSSPPPPAQPALKVDWSVKKRRSKSITVKSSSTARASPTTPLSWCAATSTSGGAAAPLDGFEEYSRGQAGSKVSGTNEATRSKKKKRKTMNELKEEEDSLLKERMNLKRKIATLRVALKEEQGKNESLRMQTKLTQQKAAKVATFASEVPSSDQTSKMLAASGRAALPEPSAPNSCLEVQKEVGFQRNNFALPDLNVALME